MSETRTRPLRGGVNVRTGAYRGLLQPRVIGRAESLPAPSWLALFVDEGEAEIRGQQGTETVRGPAIAWRKWSPEQSVRLSAGSTASYVIVGASALSNAIGHKPESPDIRRFADRSVASSIREHERAGEVLRACFSAIRAETEIDRPAASTLVEVYLRIILVEIWRMQTAQSDQIRRSSPSQRIFDQFAALVELRFRDRWTVQDYADAMGLSRDRLGDVCRRIRGRNPKEIIDRRTEREARLLLQNSTNSIDQIAGLLGFQTSAQFNRFFSRLAGEPPGRLRRRISQSAPQSEHGESTSLHDWP